MHYTDWTALRGVASVCIVPAPPHEWIGSALRATVNTLQDKPQTSRMLCERGSHAPGAAPGGDGTSHGCFTGRLFAYCTKSMPCSRSVSTMTLTLPAYF